MENVKECWSIYIKTPDHDPFFAVSDEGEIWFRGQRVETRPGLSEHLNKLFIEMDVPPRGPKIERVIGLLVEVDEDGCCDHDKDILDAIAKAHWEAGSWSSVMQGSDPPAYEDVGEDTKVALRRIASSLLNGRIGDLIYRAKRKQQWRDAQKEKPMPHQPVLIHPCDDQDQGIGFYGSLNGLGSLWYRRVGAGKQDIVGIQGVKRWAEIPKLPTGDE